MAAAAAEEEVVLLLLRVSQHASTRHAASELCASACEGSDSNIQARALKEREQRLRLSRIGMDNAGYHCELSRAAAAAADDDGGDGDSGWDRPEASAASQVNTWGVAAAAPPSACKMREMPPEQM